MEKKIRKKGGEPDARCKMCGVNPGGAGKAEKGTFAERHSFGSSSVARYHFLQPGKGAKGRES